MVHEFCIHQGNRVFLPIKNTEWSQATNIELGLQIPSGSVILTFDLLYLLGVGMYIHHVHEIFVEALNAHWKTRQLSLWQLQCIYRGWFGLTQLRKGLEVTFGVWTKEPCDMNFCESPYFETWKLMRYLVPWNGTGVDIPACNDRHASFIVEYMTVQRWSVIRLP